MGVCENDILRLTLIIGDISSFTRADNMHISPKCLKADKSINFCINICQIT